MQATKLNLDLLSNLLKDNKNAIRHALELFVETTKEDMILLQDRIHNNKYQEASRLAHSLKSRFVYLGNDDTCEKVKHLEKLLKQTHDKASNEVLVLFENLSLLINICIFEVTEELKALEN
ncbi:MAG: Hpt domain-containing protein [Opitutaceae bacterium]|nr:Hpt domain-containing protein [Cytophagales bacterium]